MRSKKFARQKHLSTGAWPIYVLINNALLLRLVIDSTKNGIVIFFIAFFWVGGLMDFSVESLWGRNVAVLLLKGFFHLLSSLPSR
jgi:hypothetical protein